MTDPNVGDKFVYSRLGRPSVTLIIEDVQGANYWISTNGVDPTKVRRRDWPDYIAGFVPVIDTPFKLVDRIERPRFQSGVDWGCDRPVMMKRGEKEFQRNPGSMYHSGTGQQSYAETSYVLIEESGNYGKSKTVGGYRYQDGAFIGRWSLAKLKPHAEQIAEYLGVTRSDVLRAGVVLSRRANMDKTVVFDDTLSTGKKGRK